MITLIAPDQGYRKEFGSLSRVRKEVARLLGCPEGKYIEDHALFANVTYCYASMEECFKLHDRYLAVQYSGIPESWSDDLAGDAQMEMERES